MKEIKTVIRVGISDLKVIKAPQFIRTSGLGSCVGVVIYDLQSGTAGLAHFMLPDSSLSREKELNIYKYADTAIPFLLDQLIQKGSEEKQLKAKIAGGAQMFPYYDSEFMRIGERNIYAAKENLKKHSIPLIAKDVGGNKGRTIEFDPTTGNLMVRIIHQKQYYI